MSLRTSSSTLPHPTPNPRCDQRGPQEQREDHERLRRGRGTRQGVGGPEATAPYAPNLVEGKFSEVQHVIRGSPKSTGGTGVAHPLDQSVAEVLVSGVAHDSLSAVGSDSTQTCLVTAAASSVGRERRLRRYGQRRYKTVPLTRPNHRCWVPANGSEPGRGRTTWLA
jgi:hypothetical protein